MEKNGERERERERQCSCAVYANERKNSHRVLSNRKDQREYVNDLCVAKRTQKQQQQNKNK